MIETREATNLFSLIVDAYAQGVNCQGVMGSGVAKDIRAMYDGLFPAYCGYLDGMRHQGRDPLGTVYPFYFQKPYVYNLFTQDKFGRDGAVYASLSACRSAFDQMFILAQTDNINSIGMPAIGAGLGGLRWNDVYDVLTYSYDHSNWGGTVVVAMI